MPEAVVNPFAASGALRGVERCVACGLCLPVCPTYRLTQDEAESPRGRIAYMRMLAQMPGAPSVKLEQHLSHCLVCRACEKACPSYVPYGQLIDAARMTMAARKSPAYISVLGFGILRWLAASTSRLSAVGKLLYCYQRTGLQRLMRASGLLRWMHAKKYDDLLPPLTYPKQLRAFYSAGNDSRGEVLLFIGCVAQLADVRTHEAAIRLLNALGYSVRIPTGQTCCGALHQHGGRTETARTFMRRNLDAFGAGTEAILTCASGCGAQLHEYGTCLETPPGAAFGARVMDISAFLARADWSRVSFRPFPRRVAVHDPCSLANTLRQDKAPYSLLNLIPGAEIVPLAENIFCCGGAGAYPLAEPEMAGRLRASKIRHLQNTRPAILVTSNIGCALHLAAGVREAQLDIEIMHPVVLLARQVRDTRDET